LNESVQPKLLGLTASPCAGIDFFDTLIGIKALMKLSGLNFKMPQKNLQDLEKYTNNHQLKIIELASTKQEKFVEEVLEIIKNDQLENMVNNSKEENMDFEEDLKNSSLREIIDTYLEAYQNQGLIPLENDKYSQDICFHVMDALKKNENQISSKAKKEIEKKYEFFTSSKDTYFKKDVLMELLEDAIKEKDPKIIIFVKKKICAKMIFETLQKENFGNKIKPTLVVGHGKGMSSNKQMSSVQEFRENSNLM
jgi:ERCC4-related helicase